ncbi:hypothetical protein JCM10212_004524, partial [Sporobolomyces blumeae]
MLSLRTAAQRTLSSSSSTASRRSLSVAAHSSLRSSSSTSRLASSPSLRLSNASPLVNKMGAVRNSHGMGEST